MAAEQSVVERPAVGFGLSMTVSLKDSPDIHFSYTGEVPKELMDAYQQVVGNALARVSVGTDLNIKDFGTGAGAMVNVSLSCNQDQQTIQQALGLCGQMGLWYAQHHRDVAEKELQKVIDQKKAALQAQGGRTQY